MPTYRYESKTSSGKIMSGVLTAATLQAASQQLRDRGEYILSLSVADTAANKGKVQFSLAFGPSANGRGNCGRAW